MDCTVAGRIVELPVGQPEITPADISRQLTHL
jgi:hypothetical protein